MNEQDVRAAWRNMDDSQRRDFLAWIGLRPTDGGPILRTRSLGLTMVHTRDIVDAILDDRAWENACRTCLDTYPEAGDGWDGECPSCADKTFTHHNP